MRARIAAAALVPALLAGCSGGSPAPSSSAATSTSPTTSTAPTPTSGTPTVPPGTGTATGTNSYVALGDSYAAGVGSGGSTGVCYRSARGWAPLVAERYGLALSYQACSGATTATTSEQQLGTLGAGTSRVSITIGGNDVGFALVLFTCASPSWLSDCTGAIGAGRSILRTRLPGRLRALFSQVRGRAPHAQVTVVGYPHVLGTRDCDALTFFSAQDRSGLDAGTDELDALLRTTAASYGFSFVDPRARFSGHAPCSSAPWINGLSLPIGDSFHPDRSGQQAYAGLVGPVLDAASGASAPRVTTAAATPDPRAAARAVLSMQLDQPENLRQAQAAGVSTTLIKRYVQDLRSSDTATISAGLAGLRSLDQSRADRVSR
ncbi:SGNH/GDSL hydrolase family protein [Allobranchiibius sp. CTAmp26]|uniref:SGNH/GDSL hydrolase family protein n=1 Tax=Allobranchiibius sp. CTAmp26 TaxID=2815214 RepID=UPI001AA0CF02|nr:SGNH/GDSL hydrolase family protein [Allobranchiibius sp. CTAmp26]MBO1753901.1 SGNH/GDSL hydrolase family protein [Allobranchiibius sp. CTAmp26]